MKRTPINPWSWSLNVGYNQAVIIEGASRQLICAGQTSVDGEGNPQHLDDMRNQIALSLDNLEAILSVAEMSLANITRLQIYTTDVDEAKKHFDVFGARFGPINASPPMTLIGVTRLAIPALYSKSKQPLPTDHLYIENAVLSVISGLMTSDADTGKISYTQTPTTH